MLGAVLDTLLTVTQTTKARAISYPRTNYICASNPTSLMSRDQCVRFLLLEAIHIQTGTHGHCRSRCIHRSLSCLSGLSGLFTGQHPNPRRGSSARLGQRDLHDIDPRMKISIPQGPDFNATVAVPGLGVLLLSAGLFRGVFFFSLVLGWALSRLSIFSSQPGKSTRNTGCSRASESGDSY